MTIDLACLTELLDDHGNMFVAARDKLAVMAPDLGRAVVALHAALIEADAHIGYCGGGDAWERECYAASGTGDRILAALAMVTLPPPPPKPTRKRTKR